MTLVSIAAFAYVPQDLDCGRRPRFGGRGRVARARHCVAEDRRRTRHARALLGICIAATQRLLTIFLDALTFDLENPRPLGLLPDAFFVAVAQALKLVDIPLYLADAEFTLQRVRLQLRLHHTEIGNRTDVDDRYTRQGAFPQTAPPRSGLGFDPPLAVEHHTFRIDRRASRGAAIRCLEHNRLDPRRAVRQRDADSARAQSQRPGAESFFELPPQLACQGFSGRDQGRKGSRAPLTLLPGFVLHGEDGAFTPQAQAILRDGAALRLG